MRVLLAAVAMCLAAAPALAIERYQTMRMTCDEVQAAVANDGEAILRWQSKRTGMPRYDRYVSDWRFCRPGEAPSFASVPTQDDSACTVQKCKLRDRFNRGRIFIPGG